MIRRPSQVLTNVFHGNGLTSVRRAFRLGVVGENSDLVASPRKAVGQRVRRAFDPAAALVDQPASRS